MSNESHEILNYSKWNRRLLNLYWICNIIILSVEIALCITYYNWESSDFSERILVLEYIYKYIFIPSGLTFLFTIICETLVLILEKKYKSLQPYVVTFTCVAFCMVLIIVHYGINVIYITCTMPIIFSLVYNDRRVLLYTFIFSLLVFVGTFRYTSIASETTYMRYNFAELVTSSALLLVTYLICNIILSRLDEIIGILAQKEHAEYELQIARGRAEAKAEARTRFFANISHDIRTPMNGIIGLAELGLDDVTDAAKQKDYLSKIKNSAEGLLGIINDILDYSKIDVGELKLEKIPFYLRDILSECETVIRPGAEEKGVVLYFSDKTELGNKLIGDPTKLRQVLMNLLSNAVKFTKEGYVSLTVKCDDISEDSNTAKIYFEIKDTGIGITKEQCVSIFEPFRQADDSTTRKYGGTGLGLSITKSIVEIMGGQIDLESVPYVGSIFSFSIIFNLLNDNYVLPEDEPSPSLIVGQPAFSGNVLVCEDNEINRQVIEKNLEKIGLKVTTVKNGKSGVDVVSKLKQSQMPYDIILMDIHMPVMDGLNAAKKLIEMGVKTPIIAMTANIMPEEKEEYIRTGMADCLSKPFKQQELWACLLKYLDIAEQMPVIVSDYPKEKNNKVKDIIDMDIGIENSAGSDTLYNKILITFLEKQRSTYIQLEKATEKKDYDIARKIAHKESGVAAIIGAVRLSELLSELEEAFRVGIPNNFADSMHDYSDELDRVLDYISGLNLLRKE